MPRKVGHAFDVGTVLGIGKPDAEAIPLLRAEDMALRVSEPYSLETLASKDRYGNLLPLSSFFEQSPWFTEPVQTGTYTIYMPYTDMANKSYQQQLSRLYKAKPAPIALVVTVLLCMEVTGAECPFNSGVALRCREQIGNRHHIAAQWMCNKVFLNPLLDVYAWKNILMAAVPEYDQDTALAT